LIVVSLPNIKNTKEMKRIEAKANVYLIPTDGDAFIVKGKILANVGMTDIENKKGFQKYHMYITLPHSELPVIKKENADWVYNPVYKTTYQWFRNADVEFDKTNAEKIIASTYKFKNQDDDDYSILSISESFIEYFINEYNKGNKIKETTIMINGWPDGFIGREVFYDYCIKNTPENKIFIIHPEPNRYSRNEVVELCWQAFIDYKCVHGKIKKSEVEGLIEPFNEWVKKNINKRSEEDY